jgi:CheY-specific phosphatase CheX
MTLNFNIETTREVLSNAISETLEGMAFMEYENVITPENINLHEDDAISEISIETPFTGQLFIVLNEDLTGNLYESITGEEHDGKSREELTDPIKEILNTLAGRFMANLVSGDIDFTIGIPAIVAGEELVEARAKWNTEMLLEFTYFEGVLKCLLVCNQ